MKLCLLNDSFPPVIDGVANAVVNYAKIIQQNGGNVTVVTPRYPNVEDNYPFEVKRFSSVDTTKIFGYRAGNPVDVNAVRRLAAEKFDIMHTHCPIASAMLARSIREVHDAPLILTYHTKFDLDFQKAIKNESLQKMALKALMSNINACDEVWVVSRGAGDNLRGLGYEGELRVMENGVDFPKGKADPEIVARLRQKYEIKDDEFIFLFVGRMMWYKGIRLLLDSLKRVDETGAKYRMLFVGDGIDRKDIEEYTEKLGLSQKTVFVGAVRDREELRGYFSMAELFLFPSSYDTNGIVVREAAACGLGSILIKDSCAAEGVEHQKTGLLAEENPEGVAAQMIYALQNRAEMPNLGQRALDGIYISWDTAVKCAVERYGEVLEDFRSGKMAQRRSTFDGVFSTVGSIAKDMERIHSVMSKMHSKKD